MLAFLPGGASACILVFVEPFGLATHYGRKLVVFHSESSVARLTDDWTVDDRDGLCKLLLVPQLIMQVDTTQENIKLRMSVDPADCDEVVVHLCLEQADLVSHVALVLLSLLPWHDQMGYLILGLVKLFACEKGQCFYFD